MESDLKSYFDKANSILIVLPKKPYFDQVAAGLSLYLSLVGKKDVSIICPTPMLVEFNRLVGVDKVSEHPEQKNLVIHFSGYDASKVEKVSSDIKDGELYLTLIPQPGAKPPAKEQVNLSYSGTFCDLIVLVGGAEESHFPILANPEIDTVFKIHVGLRSIRMSGDDRVFSYVKTSSSVTELIADIIRELDLEVDPDTASNLIAGIEVGSNYYASEGVTANTFQAVADLLRLGGRRIPFSFKGVQSLEQKREAVFSKLGVSGLEQDNQNKQISYGKMDHPVADENKENPPSDWLAPKIFKGTSVS